MIDFFPSRSVAVSLFGFSVYWYGIMYLLAFATAYHVAMRLQKYRDVRLTPNDWSDVLMWFVLGVIGGGRLGYVLLYVPTQFFQNPLILFAVRGGGMSSHGGFAAVIAVMTYLVRKYRLHLFAFADVIVIPVALGLAWGRLGNFINLELYGSVTSVPWAISIPSVEGLRHPTQIYAIIKDLSISTICLALIRRKPRLPDGVVTSAFLVSYAILRFLVEMFRVPTHSNFSFGETVLTRGQLYSVPIFILGVVVFALSIRRSME